MKRLLGWVLRGRQPKTSPAVGMVVVQACGRTEFLQNYAGAAEHPKRIVFLYRGRQPAQEPYYPGVRFMTPEEFVEEQTGQKCEDDGGGE